MFLPPKKQERRVRAYSNYYVEMKRETEKKTGEEIKEKQRREIKRLRKKKKYFNLI